MHHAPRATKHATRNTQHETRLMKYDIVIGLEVHIQIRTASKMFCSCPNKYGADKNTLVCPVCLGYPGVLPVPNLEAIHTTILAGLMCECRIAQYSKFDRKSYFYPDMPKNYQISQYDLPLCADGRVEIVGKGLTGNFVDSTIIGITRIHLEEDVAKSVHYSGCSGIDFNRAGVPLMEVVSEPELTSADEAYLYLNTLKQIMKFADISDCDMEKGQMRCDVNISLKPAGASTLNPKTELKNLNSFKAAHHGISYEIQRQSEILDSGNELIQETRGWNDDRGESYPLRAKESEDDYRYFPEPDLMPIRITDETLEAIRKSLPETPADKRKRFVSEYKIPEYDATVLTADKAIAAYFENCVTHGGSAKKIANWMMSEFLRELAQANISVETSPVKPESFAALIKLIEAGTINGKIAKVVFAEMFSSGKMPGDIVEEKGLVQVTDTTEIADFARAVIDSNPRPVQEFRDGNNKALNFLVGQIMKLSKGKANPQVATELLKKELEDG